MKLKIFTVLGLCGLGLAIAPHAMATQPAPPAQATYIYPAQGSLSSGYGWRWGRMHQGIDIAAAPGSPIVASAAGSVTYADWNDGGYGYLVEITHADSSVTLYAHNSRILVREGDRVAQGQLIAEMGSTGRSTGPHCHFEIRLKGKGAVDPLAYLSQPVVSVISQPEKLN